MDSKVGANKLEDRIRQLKNEIKKGEEEMKINRKEMQRMINENDDNFVEEAESTYELTLILILSLSLSFLTLSLLNK